MKRTLLFGAITLLAAGFFAISCSEDNPVSCTQKLTEVSAASLAYSSDPSYANCIDYKNALEDYINCDGITDKVFYQAAYDALQCN